MNFSEYKSQIKTFLASSTGQTLIRWTQRMFLVGVLAWLMLQLTEIGWINVWKSLPTNPLFYLVFFLLYVQLPLFEIVMYRVTWSFNVLRSIPAFLIKRVYNKDLVGYSGEVHFYLWANRHLDLKKWDVLMTIKDNNVISSIASTLVAIVLLSIFFFTDQIVFIEWMTETSDVYLWGGVLSLVALLALLFIFRRSVITMPLHLARQIFSIQIFRLILGQVLNVLTFYVVLPDVPLYIWFSLISVEIILSRIPFLPNHDLVFAGLSIGLAEGLQVPQADIAGIVVARAAIGKVLNILAFGLANLLERTDVTPSLADLKEDESETDPANS